MRKMHGNALQMELDFGFAPVSIPKGLAFDPDLLPGADLGRLIKRFEETITEPPFESYNFKNDKEIEIVTDRLLDKLKKRFEKYRQAANKYYDFDETYNSPFSAVGAGEREEVAAISHELAEARCDAKDDMEEMMDLVRDFIGNIKKPSMRLTDKYKSVMREILFFEGIITDKDAPIYLPGEFKPE